MSERPPGRLPYSIPKVMTLRTLADVRKLLKHVPRERRQLSTWQHVEASLSESPEDAAMALMLVLQLEHVPYTVEVES
jgi:hypothetical protein